LAVSPTGSVVFVTDRVSDALILFDVDSCGNGTVGTDEQCDDGNATGGDGCSATCRLELCASTPMSGCRKPAAGKGRVVLKDDTINLRDSLNWRWSKGQATDLNEFGDPPTTTSYLLCVYDGSGASQPLLSFAAPRGQTCDGAPCWKAKTSAFGYRDGSLTPDSIVSIKLNAGALDGEPSITVRGRARICSFPRWRSSCR